MNKNNLSWVDNSIFNNPGNTQNQASRNTPMTRPYMDMAPSQYQEPSANLPPPTYSGEMARAPMQQGLSPDAGPGNDTQGALTRNEAFDTSPFNVQGPPSVMSPGYLPAYLKTIIGKRVRAEFVFQNLYLDKTGILREVGINYFVLEDTATHAMVMCDLYSARFVTSV